MSKTVTITRLTRLEPRAAVLRKWLSGVMVATLFIACLHSPASAAIDLSQFDALDPERQARVLSAVLDAYRKYYKASPTSREFAACLNELYEPASEGGPPRLLPLVLQNIDFARADAARKHTIEGLVQGVIELQCTEK
ncbi:MAG: hypothetical protein AB7P52_15300 [Alphaproteobacteria bacterium]